MKKIVLSFASLLVIFHGAFAGKIDIIAGKAIFQSQCTSCHAIKTVLVGPALQDVFKIRSEAWIMAFVRSSQTVINGGDVAAVSLFKQFNGTIMPDHLAMSDQDIKNIIGFIKSESLVVIAQPPVSVAPDNNDPYKGESGFIRQLVYVDVPGMHLPLLISDYGAWCFIGGMIFIFLLTLFTLVKAKSLIASLNHKYDQEDKRVQPENKP